MARRRNPTDEHTLLPDFGKWQIQKDPATDGILIAHVSDRETWNLANPENFDSYRRNSLFAFTFGAYGATRVLVWEQADHIDSALEAAGEWLSEHAPGHLSTLEDEYKEAEKEVREKLGDDADEDEVQQKAQEQAEVDMTYTESGWLNSSEWHVDELSSGELFSAALYVSQALHAAEHNSFYLYMKLPGGKREADAADLDQEELLGMFADSELGLTAKDVQKISALEEDESIDLKAFRIERIG